MTPRTFSMTLVAAAVVIAVTSCAGPEAPPGQEGEAGFTGRVTRVVDGDTFWLDSRDASIRIWGLDAPEVDEAGGSVATAAFTRMIADERLTCRQRDIDRYGRIVGQCYTTSGNDIAAAMITAGVATEHCRYSGGAYGTC